MLAEISLDLILMMRGSIMWSLKKKTAAVSEEYVPSSLGGTLPPLFTEALNMTCLGHSVS